MNLPPWPKQALKRALMMNYPGARSSIDAVNQLRSKKTDLRIEPELTDYVWLANKIKLFTTRLRRLKYDEILTIEARDQLARMPTYTRLEWDLYFDRLDKQLTEVGV